MMCSASRHMIVALVVGLLVSTATGSETAGWIAAGIAVAVAYGTARLFPSRFGAATCSLPDRRDGAARPDAATTDDRFDV